MFLEISNDWTVQWCTNSATVKTNVSDSKDFPISFSSFVYDIQLSLDSDTSMSCMILSSTISNVGYGISKLSSSSSTFAVVLHILAIGY